LPDVRHLSWREDKFKIAAAIRLRLATFDCGTCSEQAKEEWGCKQPTAAPNAFSDKEDDFFNCPFLWVKFNPSIVDFRVRYNFLDREKGPWITLGKYDDVNNRFLEALTLFEGYIVDFKEQQDGK
jgi:hypothetical protein